MYACTYSFGVATLFLGMNREAPVTKQINFQTDPSRYQNWRVEYEGPVARLIMDVSESGGLFDGYELKLNSYYRGWLRIRLYRSSK
jgi:hypothetical protein